MRENSEMLSAGDGGLGDSTDVFRRGGVEGGVAIELDADQRNDIAAPARYKNKK